MGAPSAYRSQIMISYENTHKYMNKFLIHFKYFSFPLNMYFILIGTEIGKEDKQRQDVAFIMRQINNYVMKVNNIYLKSKSGL